MDAELLVIVLAGIITVYPIYLVWRFLTLGIKAFKKYLKENSFYTAPQDELE